MRHPALLACCAARSLAHAEKRIYISLGPKCAFSDPLSAHQLAMKLQSDFSALSLGITQVRIVHQQEEPLVPTSISSGPIRGVYLDPGSTGAFSKLPWLISIGFILSLALYVLYRLRVVPSTPLLSILAIFILFFIVPSATQLVHRSYANCKVLNPLLDFRLYWTVRYSPE